MKVLTANRLVDGVVVYRASDGGWTHRFEDAERLTPEAAAAALAEAQAQSGRFVGPYLVEVDGSVIEPRERLRETIRAGGPTLGHSLEWKAV